MGQKLFLAQFLAVLFGLFCAMGISETEKDLVSINRSMLARFKDQYAKLMEEQIIHPSENTSKKLTQLDYKIKALNHDTARILTPAPDGAQGFLKQLLSRRIQPLKPSETALHEKALDFVAKNDLVQAIKTYEDIILDDPDNNQAYLLMGHCLLLSGEYEKAELSFYRAVQIDPSNRDEIMPFYENTVLKDPDDDSAHADLGYAWLILGDYLKAKEAFRDALGINPENEKALKGLKIIEAKGN